MLHVTNGDVVAAALRREGPAGDVLPWRDALHAGPVPGDLGEDLLRAERARFLADRGRGSFAAILDDLAARDAALERATGEVVLWFEADLYDQLQLLQVLDRLAGQRCALIEVEAFDGGVAGLFEGRRPVSAVQRELAVRAWAAFRAPEPTAVQGLLDAGADALPNLADALRRHLAEYPAVGGGLSRTERLALELLDEQPRGPVELFGALQQAEPRPFLGDEWFWDVLADLAREPLPLLEDRHAGGFTPPPAGAARTLAVTAAGRDVLAGERDRAWLDGIDRWLGGVHLTGREPAWRWDPDAALVVPAA